MTPPATGLAAYTYKGIAIVVFASGHCVTIGAILAEFSTPAKALAWIDKTAHGSP